MKGVIQQLLLFDLFISFSIKFVPTTLAHLFFKAV